MEQSQKIKQYEQLILKGYTENFETRKSLVDFEIDNLKANGKNLTTQLQQYQREGLKPFLTPIFCQPMLTI